MSAKTGNKVESAISDFTLETAQDLIEVIPLKDIYMQFLLHLNEGFDDDLLMDCIGMLTDE